MGLRHTRSNSRAEAMKRVRRQTDVANARRLSASHSENVEVVAWRYQHGLNPNLWVVVAAVPDWPERDPDMEPLVRKSDYDAAKADRDRLEGRIAELEKALKPFADCVFNDNGDMTVSSHMASYDDFVRAYFAIRALITKEPDHHE